MPVYTIYGAAEDLTVIEKFRAGEYKVPNLHIIDETTTHLISTPSGQNIRLFGLGGSLVLHRLFDNGDGVSTIAGSPGVMWTTVLQMGQLIRTARKNFDPTESSFCVSSAARTRGPARPACPFSQSGLYNLVWPAFYLRIFFQRVFSTAFV